MVINQNPNCNPIQNSNANHKVVVLFLVICNEAFLKALVDNDIYWKALIAVKPNGSLANYSRHSLLMLHY